MKPVGPLKWDDKLSEAAFSHCFAQGKKGTTGHIGHRGDKPKDRVSNYGKVKGFCEELLTYGVTSAWDTILQLFVSDGVRSRVHRHHLMSTEATVFGGATSQHKTLGQMGTFLLCANFTPKICKAA